MRNERNRTNKNQKQRNSNTSELDSAAAYSREFAKALRRSSRSSKKYGRLREGPARFQGNYATRFWEDEWNQ